MALLFESKTCSRCGGSGSYSYNTRDGSRCFGCGGRKEVLTKRGAAAQAFLTAKRTVSIADLAVGDKVITGGITMGGSTYDFVGQVVAIGDLIENGYSETNGVRTPNFFHAVEMVNVKSGELHTEYVTATKTFRKVWAKEQDAAMVAEALAFQATLTATGTVAKRASRAEAKGLGR